MAGGFDGMEDTHRTFIRREPHTAQASMMEDK